MPRRNLTRRDFVADSSKLAVGAMIVPRHVLGRGFQAPSDTLNIAIVGAGGIGTENAQELLTENIVAVCDVDFGYVERKVLERTKDSDGKPRAKGLAWQDAFVKATRHTDFRQMLEQQPDIDAIVVATPDHLHAVIAKAAMEEGKHVYVQKPLTWSVHEARVLRDVARRTGVVTQMGNQGHSSPEALQINEWIRGGVIGPVHEVHSWTNRPIWPQGLSRPTSPAPQDPTSPPSWGRRSITERTAAALGSAWKIPDDLHWDLYLGPVAEDIPYHPIYHPFNWRGWIDFGVGALGDMGAHLLDHPYWALELGYPTSIEATSTPWGGRPREQPVSYPIAMTAHYEFPARGELPPVKLHWYDGGLMPQRPPLLPDDIELEAEGGVIFVGGKGLLLHETYGRNPRLFPASLMEEVGAPEEYEHVDGVHEMNWVRACKGEQQATSPFDYASPLTEVMLLGIVALRTGQGTKIAYDGENMRITNVPDANQYLTREYRAGWSV
ncbi:MAG: Gfo/Idh/MocA family oxidoreductase [Longimicrobiales bacterium]